VTRAASVLAWLVLSATPLAAQPVGSTACPLPDRPLPAAPAHFPPPPTLVDHPPDPRAAALGERLFFDPRLSSTGKVACATCHEPEHAFSIPEALPARGVTGRALARHALVLFNLAWADSGLFWDGGAKNLESLSLGPLTHEDELGRSVELSSLLELLRGDPVYAACFERAFGAKAITLGHVLEALAQYERSLIAASSRWDRRARDGTPLTAAEERGEHVYERHCARCHPAPLFTAFGYYNNGLSARFPDEARSPGRGRARITQRVEDLGKFRAPSLRNLGRSAPYMHDGRLRTLRAVIEHYRHGMHDSPTLDPGFRRQGKPGVDVTDDEARALEAFLRTLDDLAPPR
jgi:cytochrome c peroxidase